MKKISYWAKEHVWQTRLIIVLIYILLNIIGMFTGKLLNEINVIIPRLYFAICICFTIILWIWYPVKRTKGKRVSYTRRKLFDFFLGTVTFLMIIYAGNHWEKLFITSETAQASKAARLYKDSSLYNHPLIQNFIASINSKDITSLTQKEKLRLIKKQIKEVKRDKETSKSDKTVLIILSVLVAIGLLFGLAALSCSISCGGAEALAAIVAIAGTFLIIFLLVRIIKRISNPQPKVKEVNKMPEK